MGFYFAQFLTGLANASSLFLIASGLSIIFGVTRIVNFAHGSFYMLGAYLAYTLVGVLPYGIFGFWGSVILAAVIVGAVGVLMEVLLLRRIYHAPELFQLVATFGVVLIVQDATQAIWGAEDLVGPRAPGLKGAVRIFGEPIPQYDLALIVIGPLVLGAVWLLMNRTRWGVLVRAATEDREMTAALGVNQALLYTGAFFLGSFLAGLGGAVQLPRETVSLLMDLNIIAEAFVVVVIGGMGSITGAFLAAVIIAELNAFGILIMPQITLVLPFLVMGLVLVLRPWGLLGRPLPPEGVHEAEIGQDPALPQQWRRIGLLVLVALLLALPLLGGEFFTILATDILVVALFATSLHFIMGTGGMVSFGHAAYFGLGAYGAAMAVKYLGLGMESGLVAAPLAAAVGALLAGWFCVRLSGVYLAMLTLAAAQILWSVAFQWQDVTGGDDGILGIWPSPWASDKTVYYYLALALCGGGIYALRHIARAPFGYVLRGGRDSPVRTEAIGIDLRRHQWFAFILAGAFAGVAGGVYVFSKGSIFPDELAIPRSIDALIMVLLGGVQSAAGPVVGATVFTLLEDWVSRIDYWRAIFGAIILLIVVVAPLGVAGYFTRLLRLALRLSATREGGR